MRNLIPQWLIGFAFLYVVLQIITLELPQREERDDVMPRLFSHGNIEDIVTVSYTHLTLPTSPHV